LWKTGIKYSQKFATWLFGRNRQTNVCSQQYRALPTPLGKNQRGVAQVKHRDKIYFLFAVTREIHAAFLSAPASDARCSIFLRMRRTSIKISAFIVQSKQPNMTRTGSIDGGLPSRVKFLFTFLNLPNRMLLLTKFKMFLTLVI
jgi:hypothetical protein